MVVAVSVTYYAHWGYGTHEYVGPITAPAASITTTLPMEYPPEQNFQKSDTGGFICFVILYREVSGSNHKGTHFC
jgi:hypothetical protein